MNSVFWSGYEHKRDMFYCHIGVWNWPITLLDLHHVASIYIHMFPVNEGNIAMLPPFEGNIAMLPSNEGSIAMLPLPAGTLQLVYIG